MIDDQSVRSLCKAARIRRLCRTMQEPHSLGPHCDKFVDVSAFPDGVLFPHNSLKSKDAMKLYYYNTTGPSSQTKLSPLVRR